MRFSNGNNHVENLAVFSNGEHYVKKPGYFLKILQYFQNIRPVLVVLSEVYNINVSPVDTLNTPLSRIESNRSSSVDSGHSHSVSRVHTVHQVVVRVQDYCVWCLAGWHVV